MIVAEVQKRVDQAKEWKRKHGAVQDQLQDLQANYEALEEKYETLLERHKQVVDDWEAEKQLHGGLSDAAGQ